MGNSAGEKDKYNLCLFNVIENDCYFLGVHIRLSTRCKIWFTLGLSANYFSLKSFSLSLKSHECALKSTDLRNTSLLFDLNYKIYSWELRFKPLLNLYITYKTMQGLAPRK